MRLVIFTEPQQGASYDDLRRVAQAAEASGYDGFFRSDHFSFAKRGVPAISFHGGQDLVKGGVAAGKKAGEEYTRDRYHQPADEFDPNWDLSGMAADLQVVYDLGRRLADSREWPQWKPGSEFKGARDKTEAQRAALGR